MYNEGDVTGHIVRAKSVGCYYGLLLFLSKGALFARLKSHLCHRVPGYGRLGPSHTLCESLASLKFLFPATWEGH